jgi:hypothetical protein
VITGTAAEIAFQCLPDLMFGCMGIMFQDVNRSNDHPWCAEPALKSVTFPESFLNGVQRNVSSNSFYRDDLSAIGLNRQQGTAFCGCAVDQDITCATAAGITANVCSCKSEYIAYVLNKHQSRFNLMGVIHTIYGHGNFNKHIVKTFRSL